MKKLDLSSDLEEKIYDIKSPHNGKKGKITSYFPLTTAEKKEILSAFEDSDIGNDFHSIFSDSISENDWNKTKEQIKNKFKDELIDID